jgi:hypothetical protein
MIIVMHAARTGIEMMSKRDVKKMDQEKSSMKLNRYNNENEETERMLDMKFIAPNSELKPAKCRLKNSKSMEL